MFVLDSFVRRTWLGKAMRATAQDPEAARMMGIRIDLIILLTFFIGSALAGAAAVIFGLYYGLTSYIVGYLAGLRAFTAAVLGGIGNIPGAVLGGLLIGFVEALSGQFIGNAWSDAVIFAILVVRPRLQAERRARACSDRSAHEHATGWTTPRIL